MTSLPIGGLVEERLSDNQLTGDPLVLFVWHRIWRQTAVGLAFKYVAPSTNVRLPVVVGTSSLLGNTLSVTAAEQVSVNSAWESER